MWALLRARASTRAHCPPPTCVSRKLCKDSTVCLHNIPLTKQQHPCVTFASPEGKKIFAEALSTGTTSFTGLIHKGGMESYFRLAGQYHTQSEPAYCSVAVLCMVLNGLSIDPARIWKSPWRWYSEEMMDCCLPLEKVKESGLDFDNFSKLASCNGAHVVSYRANERFNFVV